VETVDPHVEALCFQEQLVVLAMDAESLLSVLWPLTCMAAGSQIQFRDSEQFKLLEVSYLYFT